MSTTATRLSKLSVGFNGFVSTLGELIKEWHPAPAATEIAYSNALAGYLRLRLPEDTRVEREYRHEGTTCDVCVLYNGMISDDRVLIEVKRNLRRKSDYDRLVGQIEGLKPKRNKVIVVLVGETDAALAGRLREQFKDHLDGAFVGDDFKIFIVT